MTLRSKQRHYKQQELYSQLPSPSRDNCPKHGNCVLSLRSNAFPVQSANWHEM
jgi:hypothetical protein